MGAAATIEARKPVDASDIRDSGSLGFARSEVVRLRESLGHLAKLAGIDSVVFDASDIVLGESEREDFERCVKEVAHIRACLQLHTQNSKRRTRVAAGGTPTGPRGLGKASSHASAAEEKDTGAAASYSSEDSD